MKKNRIELIPELEKFLINRNHKISYHQPLRYFILPKNIIKSLRTFFGTYANEGHTFKSKFEMERFVISAFSKSINKCVTEIFINIDPTQTNLSKSDEMLTFLFKAIKYNKEIKDSKTTQILFFEINDNFNACIYTEGSPYRLYKYDEFTWVSFSETRTSDKMKTSFEN